MKKFLMSILCALILLSSSTMLKSQTLPIVGKNMGDVRTGFQYVGTASTVYGSSTGWVLRLTSARNNTYGCAWWKNRLDLGTNVDFSAYFSFEISHLSTDGADGIGFVLQTTSSGAGSTGEGIGYAGIKPSIIVEFDTYKNPLYDPDGNHIAIMEDGNNQVHKKSINSPYILENGTKYHVWIDYNGSSLEVRINTSPTRPSSATLSYSVNLATKFQGDNIFVGFTSATGGEFAQHDIWSFLFSNSYVSGGLDPSKTYTQGPASLSVIANPSSIYVGDISNVEATAKLLDGTVAPGVDVTFSSPCGTFSPVTAKTGADGIAHSTFTATSSGTCVITAVAAGNTSTATVEVKKAPPAPVATPATDLTTVSFTANWNPVPNAEKYKLDIARDPSFTDMLTGFDDLDVGNVLSYPVPDVAPSIKYYYRIRTEISSKSSPNSNVIKVVLLPLAPVATPATEIMDNSFVANWDSVKGATSYVIDVSDYKDFSNIIGTFNDLDVGNVTSVDVPNVNFSQTSYYYRVRAVNSVGQSVNSNIIEVVPEHIKIGNLLTPNNDGKNDVWGIPRYGIFEDANVTVFNSYGQKLFNAVGYTDKWDGKYKEREMKTGEYYYLIKYGDEMLKGVILLLR